MSNYAEVKRRQYCKQLDNGNTVDQRAILQLAQAAGYDLRNGGFHDYLFDHGYGQCDICLRYGEYGSTVTFFEATDYQACDDCCNEVWAWVGPERAFVPTLAPLGDEEACIMYEARAVCADFDDTWAIWDWGYEDPKAALRRYPLSPTQESFAREVGHRHILPDGTFGISYPWGLYADGKLPRNTMKALRRKGAIVPVEGLAEERFVIAEQLYQALKPNTAPNRSRAQ